MLHRVVFTHERVAEDSIIIDYQKVQDVSLVDTPPDFKRWVIQMGMVDPIATDELLDLFGDEICEHLFDLIVSEVCDGP